VSNAEKKSITFMLYSHVNSRKKKKTFWRRGIGQMLSERRVTGWATISRPRRSFVLKIVKVGPRERSRSPQNSLLL
jgi:hypothetical protein